MNFEFLEREEDEWNQFLEREGDEWKRSFQKKSYFRFFFDNFGSTRYLIATDRMESIAT